MLFRANEVLVFVFVLALGLGLGLAERYSAALVLQSTLGSKTPYEHRPPLPQATTSPQAQPRECRTEQLYMVVRHGTRFPTTKHIERFALLQAQLQGIHGLPEHLRQWKSPFALKDEGLLAPRGEHELFELGKRTRDRFPHVFSTSYHPADYDFRASQKTRALQSASAFALGLFEGQGLLGTGGMQPVAIRSETPHLDHALRFHKSCTRYKSQVKKNETLKAQGEHALFANKWLPFVAERVAQRFGVPPEALRDVDMRVAWQACAMEAAVFNRTDGVCALVDDPSVVELFEYMDDLSDFWFKGHGIPINYEMSCPLVDDILDTFEAVVEPQCAGDQAIPRAHLRFAHAETVLPLVARLGLYKDREVLMANVPERPRTGRQWRSSAIAPFAANIALVLTRCHSEPFVQILHNEHLVRLPKSVCKTPSGEGDTLCAFDDFRGQLRKLVSDDCALEDICRVT